MELFNAQRVLHGEPVTGELPSTNSLFKTTINMAWPSMVESFLVALVSFIGVLWAVIEAALGLTVSGWASMTSIICFVSGVQLICLGVIGEYIGKIYLETKHRPRYIISEATPNFGEIKEDAQ